MSDIPKKVKSQLRDLAGMAHERELAALLEDLARQFESWKAGKMSAGDLDYAIHQSRKPARALFNRYNNAPVETLVAHAIACGLLAEEDVAQEVRAYIGREIAFYRHINEEEELEEEEPREDG
jgi:hypothetical protein